MSDNTTRQVYRLRVEGMRCRSCEVQSTTKFRNMEGVHAVHADAADGLLSMHVDVDTLTLDDITYSIVEAGFLPGDPSVLYATSASSEHLDEPSTVEVPVTVGEGAAEESSELRDRVSDVPVPVRVVPVDQTLTAGPPTATAPRAAASVPHAGHAPVSLDPAPLRPVLAGAAMALSSVSVVTSSLLLRRFRPSLPKTAAWRFSEELTRMKQMPTRNRSTHVSEKPSDSPPSRR